MNIAVKNKYKGKKTAATAPYSTMSVNDELQTIWGVTVMPK